MSGQGRQAKVLSDAQVRAALGHVDSVSRYPERDRVMNTAIGEGRTSGEGDRQPDVEHGDGRRGPPRRRHPSSQFGIEGQERWSHRPAQSHSPPSARRSQGEAQ